MDLPERVRSQYQCWKTKQKKIYSEDTHPTVRHYREEARDWQDVDRMPESVREGGHLQKAPARHEPPHRLDNTHSVFAPLIDLPALDAPLRSSSDKIQICAQTAKQEQS
eukprot:3286879-Rhodomonas_salina.4